MLIKMIKDQKIAISCREIKLFLKGEKLSVPEDLSKESALTLISIDAAKEISVKNRGRRPEEKNYNPVEQNKMLNPVEEDK